MWCRAALATPATLRASWCSVSYDMWRSARAASARHSFAAASSSGSPAGATRPSTAARCGAAMASTAARAGPAREAAAARAPTKSSRCNVHEGCGGPSLPPSLSAMHCTAASSPGGISPPSRPPASNAAPVAAATPPLAPGAAMYWSRSPCAPAMCRAGRQVGWPHRRTRASTLHTLTSSGTPAFPRRANRGRCALAATAASWVEGRPSTTRLTATTAAFTTARSGWEQSTSTSSSRPPTAAAGGSAAARRGERLAATSTRSMQARSRNSGLVERVMEAQMEAMPP
mmetsp:Transcript_9013/g.29828  ORF Transcript_9013/g.29828 Transcript_9013/m.29828 type:complete len:286 (-) Transcript_9013:113-970(-)